VSDYLDPARIAQLHEIMGSEATSMVASMVASLTAALERLDAAMAAGELEPAFQVAHAARNDALMLGADALQVALSDLELAARDLDESRARDALERVREVWPPTRAELVAAAAPH
jgi:HPt (histidine-containing phosphotransfer) domain-containing protein